MTQIYAEKVSRYFFLPFLLVERWKNLELQNGTSLEIDLHPAYPGPKTVLYTIFGPFKLYDKILPRSLANHVQLETTLSLIVF